MPTESSGRVSPDDPTNSGAAIPASVRFGLVVLNFIPLVHVCLLIAVPTLLSTETWVTAFIFLGVLYVVPALIGRAVLRLGKPLEGIISIHDATFLRWWMLFQLQAIFNRIGLLEEVLRLVPGLYSLWLRLWGSTIGSLTFWGAGTKVLDRTHLLVGDKVVFGAGVRLNPHVLAKNGAGEIELRIGTIEIGSETLVGGYALITAGSRIHAGESTAALMIMPPFSVHEGGRRSKRSDI